MHQRQFCRVQLVLLENGVKPLYKLEIHLQDTVSTSKIIRVALLVLMFLSVSSAIKSTCQVNVTEQESFAILTCFFSGPVEDVEVKFTPSSERNTESMACSLKEGCRPEVLKEKYVFIGTEHNDTQVTIGVITDSDRPAGRYKCIPLSILSTEPDVQDCPSSSSKNPTGTPLLTSSCLARHELQGFKVTVQCGFSKMIRFFQVEHLAENSSLPEPVAVCTPSGCRSRGSRYRVVGNDPNVPQLVAMSEVEAALPGTFRCKPFAPRDAYQAQLCLSKPNTPTTEATLVTSSCAVEAAREGTALVLTCFFSHETEEFKVEFSRNSSSPAEDQGAVCTRDNCTSLHGGYAYTPMLKGDKRQAEVRIVPLEATASRGEYKCRPLIPASDRLLATGCRANFTQFAQMSAGPVTTDTSTTQNSHGRNSELNRKNDDRSFYVIVTGCFVGISAVVVAVALVAAMLMWWRRGLPSQGRIDAVTLGGLSALRSRGRSRVQVSENIYEEIPKHHPGSAEMIEHPEARRGNSFDTSTQTPATRLDVPEADSSRNTVLDLSNAYEVKPLDVSGGRSYLRSGLQKEFHRRASEPWTVNASESKAQSANDNSSCNSSSRSPSKKSSFSASDTSAVYLHAVSESSIALDLHLEPDSLDLLWLMDCSHVKFSFSDEEAPPKPCGSRVDRLVEQLRASQEDGLNK